MTVARIQSAWVLGTRECKRQAMSVPMTTTETMGAPRRREDADKAPRPRRSMPGQASERGRGRTSRTSSPSCTFLPSAMQIRAPRRRHRPRRVRTLIGVAPGEVRRHALPPRVEKTACSRATLAHDRGTSPARPTAPGARTRPTSGPSTHARWRSARSAARARQPESLIRSRSRRRLVASSGATAPVDNPRHCRPPVDNLHAGLCGYGHLLRWSARAPRACATKCKNGPHG